MMIKNLQGKRTPLYENTITSGEDLGDLYVNNDIYEDSKNSTHLNYYNYERNQPQVSDKLGGVDLFEGMPSRQRPMQY